MTCGIPSNGAEDGHLLPERVPTRRIGLARGHRRARHVHGADQEQSLLRLLDAALERILDGGTEDGLALLLRGLEGARRDAGTPTWRAFARGACTRHPIFGILQEDPLTRRASLRPRGYPADGPTLDMIHGEGAGIDAWARASARGAAIHQMLRRQPLGQAVRRRARIFSEAIDRVAQGDHGASILAVATGHLRELGHTHAARTGVLGPVTVIDTDRENLSVVKGLYADLTLRTLEVPLRSLLHGSTQNQEFDLVLVPGLADALAGAGARRLVRGLFARLAPGGRLLLSNLSPDAPGRAFLEAFMDWELMLRDRRAVLGLTSGLRPAEIMEQRLSTEEDGLLTFLELRRA